jgi:hypothetical protein
VLLHAGLGEFALAALAEARAVADRRPPNPVEWLAIETFLICVAKVSKMLRPSPRRRNEPLQDYEWRQLRGSKLRRLLNVKTDSPVLDRAVRNASEHFDERIDRWISQQPRMSAEEVEAGLVAPVSPPPVRMVSPEADTVTIAGSKISMTDIEHELRRLLTQAVALEPLAGLGHPELAYHLAGIQPFPRDLNLFAPTRRPDESVLAGVDPETVKQIPDLLDAIRQFVDAFREQTGSAVNNRGGQQPQEQAVADERRAPPKVE